MKKIFIFILFSMLFLASSFGQTYTYTSNGILVDFGTVANSGQETAYISLDKWSVVDSISVVVLGTGEMDVDTVSIYPGVTSGSGSWYNSTATHLVSTIDLAASVKGTFRILSSNATQLNAGFMRGYNSLKVVLEVGASGNDATDPNKCLVAFQVWGTPK